MEDQSHRSGAPANHAAAHDSDAHHGTASACLGLRLGQIPCGALLLDDCGRILRANACAARALRAKRRQLHGQLLSRWLPQWERITATAMHGGRRSMNVDGQRFDASPTIFRIARAPLAAERTVVFITDCERRNRLRAQIGDLEFGFRQLANLTRRMLWTCGPDGSAKYFSPQWTRFTGQPREAHVGRGWLDLVHREDQPRVRAQWQAALEAAEPFDAEFRLQHASGAHRWVQVNCVPWRDRAGRIVRWMGSAIDVHDVCELRTALTRERERFSRLATYVPAEIYAYRVLPDGSRTAIFASPGIKDFYGIVPERLTESLDHVPAADAERLRLVVLDAMRNRTGWSCAWRMRHPTKGELWVEGRARPIAEDDGSTLWCGILFDVTEQKRAEAELRSSRARLQAVMKASGIGTWMHDVAASTIWFDEGALAMVDNLVQVEDLTDTQQRCVHPEDRPAALAAVQAMQEGKIDTYTIEFRNLRRDGVLQWLEVNAYADRDVDGKLVSVFGAVTDITTRKATEESRRQTQSLKALGTLAGGIAHDFNNILLAITGNVRLALADLPPQAAADSPVRRCLTEIETASLRATELVHRILTFSRETEPRLNVMQLQTPVEEAISLLRASLPAMIAIKYTCAPDTPAVLADATQIHQVVMNLVTNAAQAIGHRVGTITVSLRRELITAGHRALEDLQPGLHARLCIADDGPGIDSATLERIFDPFFTTKPVGHGTGLGLSVVHGILRAHHGAITVESELGRGTRFCLYFPAATQASAQVRPVQSAPPQGTGQRVMYIDDEEPLVYLISRVLKRLGYEVTGFTEAAQALQAFRDDPSAFDVIVTDLSMPGMSGFDLARKLLEVRPDVPILMTSGYVHQQDRDTARRLGIREFILKPNTVDELGQALAKIFVEFGANPPPQPGGPGLHASQDSRRQ